MATVKFYTDVFSKLEIETFDESNFYVTITSLFNERDFRKIKLKESDLEEIIQDLIKLKENFKNN